MNLLPTVVDKIQYFTEQRELTLLLVNPEVQEAPDDVKGGIATIFSFIDENSSDTEKKWILNLLRDIAYYGKTPPIFTVNRGEDFSIRIDLEENRDFTGFNLTIRKADTHVLLSPNDTAGDSYANAATQYALINDLALTEDTFQKVHVLLENTDGSGLANGDAATLLTEAYLIVGESIDA